MPKLDYEFIKEQFKTRGYELLEKEYLNAHVKMKYRCLKHPNIIQETSYNCLQQGRGCRLCAKNYPVKTIEEANDILHNLGLDIICIKYSGNSRDKSTFRCLKDDYIWETAFTNIKQGYSGCPKCSNRERITNIDRINERLSNDNRKIICIYYAGTMSDESSIFKCKVDGYEWNSKASNILTGQRNCPKCSNLVRVKTIKQANEILNDINADLICINYVGNVIHKSTFKCNICEHEWESTLNNIKNGNRCPRCSSSKGEKKVASILDKLDIIYISQYFSQECKDQISLPFDFYLPNYNLIIEYQGEQHYFPVDFAGKGKEWAEERFEYNKKHDKIKKDFCKKESIHLLEIPYWESKNIKSILLNTLKESEEINE